MKENIMAAVGQPKTQRDFESKDTREKGGLEKRIMDNMDKFKEQFNDFTEDEPIIVKAKELIAEFGGSSNIPEDKLDIDSSGYDDARLSAMIKLVEKN